jgi:hypothetical protein
MKRKKNVPFFSMKGKKGTWWPLGSFLVDEKEKKNNLWSLSALLIDKG